jgi:hypothetical protein
MVPTPKVEPTEHGLYLSIERETPILIATGWAFLFPFLMFILFIGFYVRKKRNNQAAHCA